MKKQSTLKFDGFEPSNTTPVPDVLFDVLLAELTGAELKVLLYIIRRTRGFKKDSDAISLSQFQKGITTKDGRVLDKGCGIEDRKTIITALVSLEARGCIQSEKGKTTEGDSATTLYRIHFREVVGNSNHRSGENQPRVVGNSNQQETVIQQTDSQETVRQEDTSVDVGNTSTASKDANALSHSPALSSENESQLEQLSTDVTQVINTQGASNGAHPSVAASGSPDFSDSRQHSNSTASVGRTSALVDRQSQVQDTRAATQEPLQHTTQEVNAQDNVAEVHTPTPVGRIAPHDGGETPTSQQAGVHIAQEDTTNTPSQSEEKPEKPARPRRPRKPRAKPTFEVPEELKPRVEAVKKFLNQWRQETTHDPEECFIFDAEAEEAICQLFQGKPPTEKKLRQTCNDMWNEPRNKNTGYLPRDHMTVPAICKQYKAKSMSLAVEDQDGHPTVTDRAHARNMVAAATQIVRVPGPLASREQRHRERA